MCFQSKKNIEPISGVLASRDFGANDDSTFVGGSSRHGRGILALSRENSGINEFRRKIHDPWLS